MELKEAIKQAEKVDLTILTHIQIEAFCTLIDHAKKSLEPLEGEKIVGMRVKLNIGGEYSIIKFDRDNNDYLLLKGKNQVWMKRSDFELLSY
jgi:hypothetical protein